MKRPLELGVLLLAVALLAGCGVSTPTRFYSLSMLGSPEQMAPKQGGQTLRLALGPLDMPAYLDRSQIVCRLSASELDMQDFHQWAEPLKDGVSRVLTENLTSLLAPDGVQVVAWQGARDRVSHRLVVRIISFDGSLGDEVELVARWEVVSGDAGTRVVSRRSRIVQKVGGGDVGALVAAHSAAVEELSRQMAGEVRGLRR